jgi:hypothetical protein
MALEASNYGFKALALESSDNKSFSLRGLGKKILKKIKSSICGILNNESGEDDIIDAVLSAIIAIIPGGVIIKVIIKKLLQFILSLGIGKFCAV